MSNQKVVLVTGGNRGIGKQACRLLAQKGFAVILGSRDLAKGEAALADLQDTLSAGLKMQVVQLDVSDTHSISEAVQWMEKTYGRLDVLINNAAVLPNSDNVAHVQPEVLEKTLRVNVIGPLTLAQKLLPLLRKSRDARIVNVSSGMGTFSEMGSGYAAYRLSKASLNGLTAIMAQDLGQEGIKVMAAGPGWCQTDMGSPSAPRTAEQGAQSIIWPAIAEKVEPSKFYRDGKVIEW